MRYNLKNRPKTANILMERWAKEFEKELREMQKEAHPWRQVIKEILGE